jgi:hypothetical protein
MKKNHQPATAYPKSSKLVTWEKITEVLAHPAIWVLLTVVFSAMCMYKDLELAEIRADLMALDRSGECKMSKAGFKQYRAELLKNLDSNTKSNYAYRDKLIQVSDEMSMGAIMRKHGLGMKASAEEINLLMHLLTLGKMNNKPREKMLEYMDEMMSEKPQAVQDRFRPEVMRDQDIWDALEEEEFIEA